jgi:hypothetical protein
MALAVRYPVMPSIQQERKLGAFDIGDEGIIANLTIIQNFMQRNRINLHCIAHDPIAADQTRPDHPRMGHAGWTAADR